MSTNSGNGLVHIYTGEGKGKTTASVGLAVRAKGAGLKVAFAQFMKGMESSEIAPLRDLGIEIVSETCSPKFVFAMNDDEKRIYHQSQSATFRHISSLAGNMDVVVLDEITSAITMGMVDLGDVLAFLDAKPDRLEVVMTGRDPADALVERADYVSNITCRKHPYEQGVAARKGIEY